MSRTTSAAILIVGMLLAACNGGDAATTTTSASVSTTEPSTTTTLQPTTTTTTDPAPTTTIQDGTVGSRQALLEAMEPAIESSVIRYNVSAEAVPVPNLSEGDPVAALSELIEFDFWVYTSAPSEAWASILAVPDSPNWTEYVGGFNALAGRVAVFDPSVTQPFEIVEIRLANPEERAMVPSDVLVAAGDAAVVVFEKISLSPHTLMIEGRPELDLVREGYVGREALAVLVPTSLGWQYFWDSE